MRLVTDSVDFEQYLSRFVDSEQVVSPSSFYDGVVDRFYGDRFTSAPKLPWKKTEGLFDLREGETTLWAGVNSHGKTLVTGQVAFGLMQQGEKVAIASFEMPPEATMARMARMAYGGIPPKEYIRDFLAWTEGRLWLFDHRGTCNQKRLLGVMRYCAEEHGINSFFIDNLTKIAVEDDYKGQQQFVDSVTAVGTDTKMHCHLIAHVRKGQSEYDIPDKFDIKGSGAIADQVDNAVIVWRNKRKEDKIKVPSLSPEDRQKLLEQPDCVLLVNKQRHGEWEGKFSLWMHQQSVSFLESKDARYSSFHVPTTVELPKEESVVFEW